MLLALLSPITLFLIAPFALLLSLIGMRRAPRGMALSGLILSLMATTVLSLGIVGAVSEHNEYQATQHARIVAAKNHKEIKATLVVMKEAQQQLRDFRTENDLQLPNLEQGMDMTVQYEDAWGTNLCYGVIDDGCIIRSMGPDQEFNTADDLTLKLDGKPMIYNIAKDATLE